MRGSKNPNWRGGISNKPYCESWQCLSAYIRERDDHKCQNPYCNKQKFKLRMIVHHIDYDKQNCDPRNLITLCDSCHGKTQFNRDRWKLFCIFIMAKRGFRKMLRTKIDRSWYDKKLVN